MRSRLPNHLIHSILLLSVALAETTNSKQDELPEASILPQPISTIPASSDIGFTFRQKWADLRTEAECPVGHYDGVATFVEELDTIPPVETSVPASETGTPSSVDVTLPASRDPDDFVSFEDWKRKKQEEDEESDEIASTTEITTSEPMTEKLAEPSELPGDNASQKANDSKGANRRSTGAQSNITEIPHRPAHKYNYASPDCSARIHSSSSSTQHASSLLHKSRDRYMLTPCKADEHWVVIELCDEIRIEAVEVAVWEFFSGVVREVRVSVGGADEEDAEDYPGDDVNGRGEKWEEVGAFIGKNVRGVQTFSLSQPTSFHRFIRLDFPSFYGTEYYCPVSQLKVYGMNQMEAFKWEQKRIAATVKEKDKERSAKDREADEKRAKEKEEDQARMIAQRKQEDRLREKELEELERLVREQAVRAGKIPTAPAITETVSSAETRRSSSTSEPSSTIANTTDGNNTNSTTTTYSRSAPPRSDSSESIYAFIIRRLNALEGNSSLVARYIEEQTKVMRLMLGRVEKGWDEWKGDRETEDRARWEQERMRHEDRLGRVLSQMEQQRIAMDQERRAILAQLRVLADEIGYERRRGLAQLFLILVIIILGAASRSSTIDAVLKPLLAEAKRRRSFYRKSISGPLSGLVIDMDQPTAKPTSKADDIPEEKLTSPIGMKRPLPTSISRPSPRRPTTPLRRRQLNSTYRSFSENVPFPQFSSQNPPADGFDVSTTPASYRPTSPIPRPRVSLPARPIGYTGQRKLAKSAHLHTLEGDRVRETSETNLSPAIEDELTRLAAPGARSLTTPELISPMSTSLAEGVFSDQPDLITDDLLSDIGN